MIIIFRRKFEGDSVKRWLWWFPKAWVSPSSRCSQHHYHHHRHCHRHQQHHSHYCIVTGCSPVWSRPLHCPCETRQVHLWYWSHKTLCSGDIVIIIGIDIAIRRNKLTSVISREFTQLRSWLFEVDAPGVWICLMSLFGRDSRSQGHHHHHHYHCHHPALQRWGGGPQL